jgi:hypothetical protein
MKKHASKYVAMVLISVLTSAIISFAILTTRAQNLPLPPEIDQSIDLDPPEITLFPPVGPVQTPITVKGTGFTPSATVDLYWFGYIASTHSLGYYPIETGVTAAPDGTFTTTIIAPFDFGINVPHNVNATQNGVGTGITNATFAIVPSMQLNPGIGKYKEGQKAILHIYGAPAEGIPYSPAPGAPPEIPILKLTYDNNYWGWIWSHMEPVPVATGYPTGDVGGNATIRFRATGEPKLHSIRAYEGSIATIGPWLGCEIGGEVLFYIDGLEH